MLTQNHRPRFGILSLLLLIAAAASWVGWLSKRAQMRKLETEIAEMRPLAGELLVEDTSQYALFSRPEAWMNESIWDVYLPEGNAYELCGTYENILKVGFAKNQPQDVLDVEPGRHVIELRRVNLNSQHTTTVILDGKPVFVQAHSKNWKTGVGSSSIGQRRESIQQSTKHALRLLQLTFNSAGAGQPRANGILLWIRMKGQPES